MINDHVGIDLAGGGIYPLPGLPREDEKSL